MDLNDHTDIGQSPFMAGGRQIRTLEEGFQHRSREVSHTDCSLNRMHTDSEYWHMENDGSPTFRGDLLQAQSLLGSHRAKRQHFWASTSHIADEEGPGMTGPHRTEIGVDGAFTKGLQTDLFGYYGMRSGSTDFNLLPNPGDDVASSSNASSFVQPKSISEGKTIQANAGVTLELNTFGGPRTDISATFDDYEVTRDLMSKAGEHTMESVNGRSLVHLNTNGSMDARGCVFDRLQSGASDGVSMFQPGFVGSSNKISGANQASSSDIRGTCKRKLSNVDFEEASRFDRAIVSQNDRLTAMTGVTGANRLDSARFANRYGASSPDQMFDDSNSESNLLRPVTESNEVREANLRSHNASASQESNSTQLHSLFAPRNVRFGSSPRMESDVFGDGTGRSTSATPDVDHWPAFFGGSRFASPSFLSWGVNSGSRRRNSAFTTFGLNERDDPDTTMEESHDGFSRVPAATLMENRLSAARNDSIRFQSSTSASSPGSAIREMNPPHFNNETGQFANSYINVETLSSYLSSSGSNGHHSSRNPTVSPASTVINSQRLLFDGGRSSSLLSSNARRESHFAGPIQGMLGLPFRGLDVLSADGEYRRQFLSEILTAMHHALRSENLNIEELVMMDPSLIYGEMDHDEHRDLRLDVDNMSYEELLALEESIGDVCTGLTDENITLCLRESKYSSLDATIAAISQDSDIRCSICQDEFVEEDDLGTLDCGHGYHSACIKQWLLQKNACPVCKNPAYAKP